MEASYIFKTDWGWIGLGASSRGIEKVVLPRTSRRSVAAELARKKGAADPTRPPAKSRGGQAVAHPKADAILKDAREQVVRFLAGRTRRLTIPIDLTNASPYQRRVWRAARQIRYGRARSYQWVAARVGGKQHARAVGLALGANPVPLIVPCHRVVAHDGSLGGFSGGLGMKKRLLALEGALNRLNHEPHRSRRIAPGS